MSLVAAPAVSSAATIAPATVSAAITMTAMGAVVAMVPTGTIAAAAGVFDVHADAEYSPAEFVDQRNGNDRADDQENRQHSVGFFWNYSLDRKIRRCRTIDDNNTGLARRRCGKAHRVINSGHLNPRRSFGKDRQS